VNKTGTIEKGKYSLYVFKTPNGCYITSHSADKYEMISDIKESLCLLMNLMVVGAIEDNEGLQKK